MDSAGERRGGGWRARPRDAGPGASRAKPPPADCAACPVRRFALFAGADHAELALLREMRQRRETRPARTPLYFEGDPAQECMTLFFGWAFRYKLLADGRRQILDFLLPGDFLGLQEDGAEHWNHSAQTITDASFCIFPRETMRRMLMHHARLAEALRDIRSRDEAAHFEHMTDLGRSPAYDRLAHLLLELHERLYWRGMVENGACPLPLTQELMADAAGLSLEHVNRLLRQFREEGWAEVRSGQLRLADVDAFAEATGFTSKVAPARPII